LGYALLPQQADKRQSAIIARSPTAVLPGKLVDTGLFDVGLVS